MLVGIFLGMSACTQDENLLKEADVQNLETVQNSVTDHMKFAQILSKAVSNSLELRKFLKKEAVKQFDKDYDVFYPLVKDKIVIDNQTFRDILMSYCEDKSEFERIEQSQPLLNILIPDLTLFWDFNAEKWNPNNEEIAVISRDDKDANLYENGEKLGKVAKNDIPGFPCLVVKNNERMEVAGGTTRSDSLNYKIKYNYINLDETQRKTTRHADYDIYPELTENLDAYVPGNKIMTSVIQSYHELSNIPNACQRDFIYYNINKTNKPGNLNRNIRESLFRFRLTATAFKKISDSDGDPKLQDTEEKKRYLSNDEIISRMWTDGNFDIIFTSYIAAENSKDVMAQVLAFSVPARQVYSISKVHIHHVNRTLFRHSKNFYSINSSDLRSKWI